MIGELSDHAAAKVVAKGQEYARIAAVPMLIGLVAIFVIAIGPRGVDFLSFWSAGKLVLSGQAASAFDPEALRVVQESVGARQFYPFFNPPPFLLLVAPFALVPYPVALAIWLVGGLALYLSVARRVWPKGLWLAALFPPVFINAANGQNGFVTASLFLGAVLLLEKRPWLAGALFGALVIKPQLALLVPVALVAAGQWRAIGGAAASSLGLLAVSELVMPGALAAFVAGALGTGAIFADPELTRKIHSLYAALVMAGVPSQFAMAAQIACAAAMAALVWRVWRGGADPMVKGAVLAAAAPLATPYIFDYDLILLILPLAIAARRMTVWLPAVYLAPLFTRGLALLTAVGLAPLMFAALLWASLRAARPRTALAGALAPSADR